MSAIKPCSSDLPAESLRRYARHIVLPEIGEDGQRKLLAASVLLIGAGGLGSAAAGYLAATGIGRIGIVEPDRVELSNLQRQILYDTYDIGRPKAGAAQDRIEEINPDCQVELFQEIFADDNANSILKGFDIVIDASDNFATRFAINDACFAAKIPLISAAISGFYAQASTFKAYLGSPHPCYRCLIPETPEREIACAQEGIAGPLAGMMGSLQALEAIKELLGIGESLSGSLLIVDALSMNIRKITLPKDPHCSVCQPH